MHSPGRVFAVLVGLVGALNTVWASTLPPAARPPGPGVAALWGVALLTHATLYWFGTRLRERFAAWPYAVAQAAILFSLGATGAPSGLVLVLFGGLTVELTILFNDKVATLVVTAANILLFAIASMISATLYQGASAALVLALAAVAAHSLVTLLRRAGLATTSAPAPETASSPVQEVVAIPGGLGLTDREADVARILGTGARTSEIASELQITERTVKTHLTHIYQKLGVRSRAEVIAILRQEPRRSP